MGHSGAINGKADPRPLDKNLEQWADGKDLVPVFTSTPEENLKVLEARQKYKQAIAGIKRWAA